MKRIRLKRAMYLEGVPYEVGEVAIATDEDARCAINAGHAEAFTGELIATEDGIATAVPGGKRPGRKRPNSA